MFPLLFARAEEHFLNASRSAVLGLGAGVFLCFGLGFLTFAAWLFLASISSAITAAVILGCFYMGVGIILLGVMRMRARARKRARALALAATAAPLAGLGASGIGGIIAAFMGGLAAGAKARS